jgi:hypothetical protein
VLLTDEFIERARAHTRGKRRAIGALKFDIFIIPEKILHEGNYGGLLMQAIVSAIRTDLSRGEPATSGRQTRLSITHSIRAVTILR